MMDAKSVEGEKDYKVVEERTLEMENLKTNGIEVQADIKMVNRLVDGSSLKQNNDSKEIYGSDVELVQGGVSKPWVTLFADNQLKEKGSELKFVTPTVLNGRRIVRFHSAEVIQEENRWKNTLLGCVYGLQPRMERITSFAQARWRRYGLISVSKVNSELFLFQFNDEQGRDQYWQMGHLLLIIIL